MTRGAVLLFVIALGHATAAGQGVPQEYRIKAAYLYNFLKFVEWPQEATPTPLTICVAGRNPFGTYLEDTVRGEQIQGRPVIARVILEPEANCHVVFVPNGAATAAYLRAARGTATLTVGESAQFIMQGGIVNFVLEGNNVRFEIDPIAAELAKLRLSSRLLQLAIIARPAGNR